MPAGACEFTILSCHEHLPDLPDNGSHDPQASANYHGVFSPESVFQKSSGTHFLATFFSCFAVLTCPD